MKEVKGVEKSMTVGSGNYSYKGVPDKEVKDVFKNAMSKHGLCILPIGVKPTIHIERWQETNQYGTKMKQSVLAEVETKYLLLHDSGESIELAGYGIGVDSGDKASGKALTYSLKYTLLYTFLTPTGTIDDSDNTHSEEQEKPPAEVAAPKTKPKMTKEGFDKAMASENVEALTKALTSYEMDTDQMGGISLRIEELKDKK